MGRALTTLPFVIVITGAYPLIVEGMPTVDSGIAKMRELYGLLAKPATFALLAFNPNLRRDERFGEWQDGITPESWSNGNLTTKEYAAHLQANPATVPTQTYGPFVVDGSYVSTALGQRAKTLVIRKDPNEDGNSNGDPTEEGLADIGENGSFATMPDDCSAKIFNPDNNRQTMLWKHKIVPAGINDEAIPWSPTHSSIVALEPIFEYGNVPVELHVVDKREETPVMRLQMVKPTCDLLEREFGYPAPTEGVHTIDNVPTDAAGTDKRFPEQRNVLPTILVAGDGFPAISNRVPAGGLAWERGTLTLNPLQSVTLPVEFALHGIGFLRDNPTMKCQWLFDDIYVTGFIGSMKHRYASSYTFHDLPCPGFGLEQYPGGDFTVSNDTPLDIFSNPASGQFDGLKFRLDNEIVRGGESFTLGNDIHCTGISAATETFATHLNATMPFRVVDDALRVPSVSLDNYPLNFGNGTFGSVHRPDAFQPSSTTGSTPCRFAPDINSQLWECEYVFQCKYVYIQDDANSTRTERFGDRLYEHFWVYFGPHPVDVPLQPGEVPIIHDTYTGTAQLWFPSDGKPDPVFGNGSQGYKITLDDGSRAYYNNGFQPSPSPFFLPYYDVPPGETVCGWDEQLTLEHGGNVVIEFLGPHYLTGPYTFHINSDQNLTITEPNSATGTVDIVTGAVFEEDAPYAEVDVRLATGTTGHVKFYANAQKKP